jgi:hypothetical protein
VKKKRNKFAKVQNLIVKGVNSYLYHKPRLTPRITNRALAKLAVSGRVIHKIFSADNF